jgi:hypothetical protein
MQPTYAQPLIIPNSYSQALLQQRKVWEEKMGIAQDDLLVFRAKGTGNTTPIMIKSTLKSAEHTNYEPMKTLPVSVCIPNEESIVDKGSPSGYVHLVYYEGGFLPGKTKAPVMFRGLDETVITVVPQDNPALYDFLSFGPRLKNGPLPTRLDWQYELLRPDAELEANWDDEEKLALVILAVRDASIETLTWLAPKVNLPAETSTEQRMRKNFSDYVKLGPTQVNTLQQLFDADETLIYQQVEQAVQAEVVAVDKEKMVWVFTANQQAITPASPVRNNIDQLVAFLMLEQDQPTLKQIIALLGDAPAEVKAPARRGGRPPKSK